jgi:hypothetical protein
MPRSWPLLAVVLLVPPTVPAAAPVPDIDRLRCPRPAEFALVFSSGYAGDKLPADDSGFEKLLVTIRKAGFNVVHCAFSEARLKLCRKHGVKMMVDLLAAEHHVYKEPRKAKALCERLRGDEAVWGYNIWNDPIGKSGPGRQRDIRNVRLWDSTHPAYCGTYRVQGLRHLNNADVIGYYDFHWKRGIDQHFGHLLAFHHQAKATNAWFMSWLSSSSGQAGKGNFNRNLYSANTALACGQKGIIWFLGTELLDLKTMKWTTAGDDIRKVHERIGPAARQLHALGQPESILSTKVTKTPNNSPLPNDLKERLPPGLDKHAIGQGHWLQRVEGEFLLGVFRDSSKRPVVYVVNHNAYAEQPARLKAAGAKSVSRFDRQAGRWKALAVKDGVIEVKLEPAGAELLWFEE